MTKTTRRSFLGTAAAGAFFIPARTLYGQDLPRKQLRLAMVGAGGIGAPTCDQLCQAGATVAALCDVNAHALAAQAKRHPGIPTYMDWRELFKHHKDFDPAAGRFTNCPEANAFLAAPSRGAFSMKDFA